MNATAPLLAGPPKPVSRAFWFSQPATFAFLLAFMFLAIMAMARANALTFPLPNEDDASFFFPAWSLAVHGTLRVNLLNAPDGIFWVPDGFYLWLALFLRLFAPSIEVARNVCQVTTATAAVALVVAYSRICRSRGFALLCGLLLISPGVIFAANIVRMESLMLLLLATALLLHTYELRLAAAAVLFLGMVVHPALLLGAAMYATAILWVDVLVPTFIEHSRSAGGPSDSEAPPAARIFTLVIVAVVGGAIALQSLYVLNHLPTFHQHMAYQIARKANRSLIKMLLTRRGLFLIVEAVFTATVIVYLFRRPSAWRIFVRQLLPLFMLAAGLSVYATLGREIPYNVYSYAVVPATYFCLTYRLLSLPLSER